MSKRRGTAPKRCAARPASAAACNGPGAMPATPPLPRARSRALPQPPPQQGATAPGSPQQLPLRFFHPRLPHWMGETRMRMRLRHGHRLPGRAGRGGEREREGRAGWAGPPSTAQRSRGRPRLTGGILALVRAGPSPRAGLVGVGLVSPRLVVSSRKGGRGGEG